MKKYTIILQRCNEAEKIYIYGAGKIGRDVFNKLTKFEVNISGFLVSDDKYDENISESLPIPILSLNQVSDLNSLIIVALNEKNTNEVKELLNKTQFRNILYLNDLNKDIRFVNFNTIATHRTEPLEHYNSNRKVKRINLVTDSINANLLLGGVATALIVATEFANKYHYELRIITREAVIDPEPYKFILKMNHITECEKTSFITDFENEEFILDITEDDIFFATSWWSAQAIKGTTIRKRFFYIIQEVETFFYPHGVDHYLCSRIMKDENIDFIVNSHYLKDYFMEHEPNIIRNGIYFEPAFSETIYHANQFGKKDKYKLFFYARPNNPRNLYSYGVYLISQAIKQGLFPEEKWEICFAGANISNIQGDIDSRIKYMGQMSWKEYAMFLREVDLAISLMYTPHPSYPPYDVACSGGVVVSNQCLNKIHMEECDNIILSELEEESFIRNLEKGIELACDLKRREKNYKNSTIKRDWHETLQNVMEFMGERL